MDFIAILIGLGPLLGWGLFPTIASKFGGRPVNQIFGATVGTLIFAIVLALFKGIGLPGGMALVFSLISGAGWAFGQIITFKAFELVGSSRAMPITTAFQLLGASLWGVFALGNWPGITNKIIGFLALLVILIGARMTVWTETKQQEYSKNLRSAVLLLLVGEIGYWVYSAAPQATDIGGFKAFLPQAIGMVIVAVIYALMNMSKGNAFKEKVSWQQIISGFFFAFAALTYLISAQPNMNGLATGFVLSQTSVVLATLTGIFFLNQKKTSKELMITIVGLVLILVAASITVFIK
ncbi:GRP family sugar transporter [Staphylococcus epidermidis]|jgi:putative ribose uptake protein rbsU|uniref:ribose/proton symporter RbsU n=1 Tax=Staphylococcus epidermidis TaxID=1282 RepID=UPI0002432E35|nr:ribose transporter RbsU [Staphylococcus epidermidis]EHM64568.1 sugar transport protein [Staphylococcus epidermidis VCU071]KAB2192284.1 ribose transporter RbsU [Staphylococcus epidermidis]MBE0334282.1 GRP family sugar transporter [Staphylococcus epidermidis]MBM0767275.1 ribose transporter RbsU [Staphylococcus epidermidis]MBO0389842.1 GRP family sugar transporter [Staphylococcus epidermidis]